MKNRRGSSGRSTSKRKLVSSAMKATSHPTRELILRELKEAPRSTLELEEVTGESRYNLYHHLSVLEDAQLVRSSISEGRAKVFELFNPNRPDVAFVVLDGGDKKEAQALKRVLEVLQDEIDELIPFADEIGKAKLIFDFPWSSEE